MWQREIGKKRARNDRFGKKEGEKKDEKMQRVLAGGYRVRIKYNLIIHHDIYTWDRKRNPRCAKKEKKEKKKNKSTRETSKKNVHIKIKEERSLMNRDRGET